MKAWMSSNFGQIPPQTPELSALNRQIVTKFCIHIIIDKINISIVNLCFSKICNRVTALD